MLPSNRRPVVVLAAFLTLLLACGCATERQPINKVQANALAKSFFVGKPGDPTDDPEFYSRNFVVDGSEAQELVGIGSWGGVDRIKWEISENTLFARRSYGQNQGADNKGSGPGFPNGTIVAAYKIDKHFDIKRDYNPQTGEELNVVIENDTDRPWYERDYFRVDWSENQVDSPDWSDMFIGKLVGDITVTPVSYYVSDPNQDDAPHFETPAGYFDVTSKFLVAPTQSIYQGLPQCGLLGFLTGTAIQNCDAQEAVVRSSYWRVDQSDPDNDFEPFENTLAPQDIFGNPGGEGDSISAGIETPPRASYDPGYQYTDAGLRRYMHIHNVWKQSHQTFGHCTTDKDCPSATGLAGSTCLPSRTCTIPCNYDARADGNADGTDDQCDKKQTHYAGSNGAQCSAKNRCTIPYRDREITPIKWWVNTDMPDVLQDTLDSHGKRVGALGPTEDVVFTWNQAIALGIAHSREAECRRTGDGTRPECHQKFFDDGSEMLSFAGFGIDKVKGRKDVAITCHNPVRDYDAPDCGPPNTIARVGDVRRNFIFYWPFASRAPWGGIANWNADPLTGQMIGAAATVMGRSATMNAALVRDVLMVANHELDMTDITGGTPSRLYQRTLQLGQKPTTLSSAEIARRVATVDVKNAATSIGLSFAGGTTANGVSPFYDMLARTTADPGLLSEAMTELDGIAKPLIGSQYETQLVSPSWLVDAAGLDPSSPLDDATLAQVSPLRGRDPAKTGLLFSSTLAKMGDHGVCTFAGSDGIGSPDVRGVAQWFGAPDTGIYGDAALKKAYPELAHADIGTLSDKRAGLIYDHLTKETYKGIALHEVGHALGMFHNFASSFDATNYDPQYWQLRTNEGASTASCNATPRPSDGNDTCMGPRFLDPETDDELGQLSRENGGESRPGINYFGNTSTMEYQNEYFFVTVGMGQYDMMTMGALYGRVLETFDPDAMPPGVDQTDYQFLNFSQLVEDNLVNWTPPLGRAGIQPMHYTELARRLNLFDQSRCRAATPDELNRAEWRIVHGKICSPPPKDHAMWGDFVDGVPGAPGITKAQVGAKARSGAGNVRWPYRFGQMGGSYVQINPSDAGADIYEATREAVKKFDYSYAFQYFRRQRTDYNYDSIPSLTADRFFERLRSYHWVAALNNSRPPDVSDANLAGFEATDDVWRANALAEHEMFGALARSIVMPQIGTIGAADPSFTLGQSRPLFDAVPVGQTGGSVTLDASNARFVDPDYENSAQGGGAWNYINYINHAGFDIEKSFAAQALADPRPTLAIIQRDTFIDGRHLFINFRTDMAKGVDRVIGGIVSGDWESVAEYFPPGVTDPVTLDLSDNAPARPGDAANATLLFPNLGYRQQLAAIIWAQLFARLGTDLTLANKMLITLEGTVGVIDTPPAEQTLFSDPRSGFTYVARLYGPDTIDGKTVDSGIGSRMIAHANDLLALAYQVARDANGKVLLDDQFRQPILLDALGNAILKDPAITCPATLTCTTSGQPVPTANTVAMTGFSDYVGLLDAVVQIAAQLGHGPLPGAITGPPQGP